MPALFVWRNRRPAWAIWSGLFRVRGCDVGSRHPRL